MQKACRSRTDHISLAHPEDPTLHMGMFPSLAVSLICGILAHQISKRKHAGFPLINDPLQSSTNKLTVGMSCTVLQSDGFNHVSKEGRKKNFLVVDNKSLFKNVLNSKYDSLKRGKAKQYFCRLRNRTGVLHSTEPRKAAKTTALLRNLAGFLENNSAGWEETLGECLCAEEKGGVYKARLEPIRKAGKSRGGGEM